MEVEFAIDGVEMPRPSDWEVDRQILSSDSERLIGSGKAIVPYLTTVYVTTWKYKYLSSADYDKLDAAYIKSTIANKSMYHTLTTRDSNSDDILTIDIYTQGDFKAPLYRIKNGVRYYKDVTFTFVGLGGDE